MRGASSIETESSVLHWQEKPKMKLQIAAAGLLACALFIPMHNQAKSPAAADAIRQNEVMWNQDFEAKDAAKLLAHYTNDATLMAPSMPPAHGKDTIAKVLQEMISDHALSLKFQATRVEVSKSGDMAYTEGAYSMT
jgi:ketosteroid isomerase-like protein